MAGSKYSNDIKEKAFFYWYEVRSDTDTVQRLKQEGYIVTRQTIAAWRNKYDWHGRADKIDIKKQAARDESISFEEGLLADMLKQKERYDNYFDNLDSNKVDNQAMFVYKQLCDKIVVLKNKIKPKQEKKTVALKNEDIEEIRKNILGI